MSKIVPTVGRVIWYRADAGDHLQGHKVGEEPQQPLAALVVAVHDDETVNLTVFDANGGSHGRTNIHIQQEGEETSGNYAEWMPFQKGQAAKTDAPIDPASSR